jgi:cell division protein FtsW
MTATTTRTIPAPRREADADRRASVLHRPLASYYLVLASTAALLGLGLVMVFSASSVRSYATYHSSYAIAMKQAIFMAVGIPCMWVASRLPVRVWRALGYPLLLAAIGGLVLVLVPGIGRNVDGATRWIPMPGGFNIQPSELGKLAIVLWGADLLVRKKKLLGEWKHLFVPLLPVAGLVCFLVMLEPDMGTTLATVAIVVALLWVVGTPLRYFASFLAVLGALGGALAVAEPYRLARLTAFLHPFNDPQGTGYQAVQGLYALSSGGWFGLGLGASREKWAGGLPNAHTDFVFAIIGEELGLIGTLAVLALFALLAIGLFRVVLATDDVFVKIATGGVLAWVLGQALINIGAVVGLLPVIGVPLPLVSSGGSALMTTLIALGMVLGFARRVPGAAEALASRPSVVARSLAVLPSRTRSRPGNRSSGRRSGGVG